MGDLTLIGTGSEWFWTMVSGLVVAITFVVIYRQLKAQGAANAFQRIETVHGRWGSPELILARLQVARSLRDGTLDDDDTRVDAVLNFFELVRDLNRQGYLDDEEIARSFGAFIVVWWRLLEPAVRAQASLEGDPEMWIGLQELATTVRAFDSKRGVDRTFVHTMPVEELLASVIRRETNRLQLARDAAAGVIPGEDGVDLAQAVAAERIADAADAKGD